MIANYHTHTYRCKHAMGGDEEYVRCAIAAGLQTLGFSDHTPYPFPGGYVSTFRMGMDQLEDYVASVRGLRQHYAGQIEIRLGVEAEYYPKFFPDLVEILKDHGIQYMILGQHMIGNEMDEPYCGIPDGDVKKLERYCDQSIEAMHTGLFTYFAHPDLFHFVGDKALYQAQMRRICKAANECRMPVEFNLLGLHNGRHYPNPAFWEVAAEENCRVVLGLDAHQPQMLLDETIVQRGLAFLAPLGLQPLENISLRSIR